MRAKSSEAVPYDWDDARLAYGRSRRSEPHDVFMDWFERQGVASLRFSEPIDMLDVGAGGGELTLLMLNTLITSGVAVRSLTCVEPNAYGSGRLNFNVQRMQAKFPDTIIRVAPTKLEEFSPLKEMPAQFHLVVASHMYPFLSDQEHCFALLTNTLLHPSGRTILTADMAMGTCGVVRELCENPAWLHYNDHIFQMHIGVLQEWARQAGLRSQLDVLWGEGIDVSACFRNGRDGQLICREGELILSMIVGQLLSGSTPESFKHALDAVEHHSHLLRTEPTRRILPDPFGVLVVYSNEAELEPGLLPSTERAAERNRILDPWGDFVW
jgi:hypothetical protein